MLQVKASKAVFCFHAAHQRDWVFTNEPLCYLDPAEGMRTLVPMVAPANYGPPERCFGHEITSHPAVVITPDGQRASCDGI